LGTLKGALPGNGEDQHRGTSVLSPWSPVQQTTWHTASKPWDAWLTVRLFNSRTSSGPLISNDAAKTVFLRDMVPHVLWHGGQRPDLWSFAQPDPRSNDG